MGPLKALMARRDASRSGERRRRAGDEAERLASDFDAARSMLRVVPVARKHLPPGDVFRDGLTEDGAELLALDAGVSLRFVSQSLADSWDRPMDEVWARAEENSAQQPFDVLEDPRRDSHVQFLIIADGTPCITGIVRALDRIHPAAVGELGTLVGIAEAGRCGVLPLSAGQSLRRDMFDLVYATFDAARESMRGLYSIPFWRRPDGTLVEVRLDISERGEILGSYDAAFDGVLRALDPTDELHVPSWARPLDAKSYTSFVGYTSAVTGIPVPDVEASPLPLPELLVAWRDSDPLQRYPTMVAAVGAASAATPQPAASERGALDPSDDSRMAATLTETGLTYQAALRFLSVLRTELSALEDPEAIARQISPRFLHDLAVEFAKEPETEWPRRAADELSERAAEVAQLRDLERAPFDVVRSALWIYLYPESSADMHPELGLCEREILPGLYAVLTMRGSGTRHRPVREGMLRHWDVAVEAGWTQAEENVATSPVQWEPWPDADSPVRTIHVPGRDSEYAGLLVHRMLEPSPGGHIVALPYRGSALCLRLDGQAAARALPTFAHLAAGAFRQAAQYRDQLSSHVLWIRPDGTPVVLMDMFDVPRTSVSLPEEFRMAVATIEVSAAFQGGIA